MFKIWTWVSGYIVLLSAAALAQVPALIQYQGRLLNGTNLVNGSVPIVFRLYPQETGGMFVYEDSNMVSVVDGLYAAYIGDGGYVTPLATVLTNQELWIEAVVNGTPLAPRERLVAVGYALMASGVSTGSISEAMLANGAVTAAKLASGAVQSNHLAVGAVQTVNIATGAVCAAQLQDQAVTAAKLASNGVGFYQLTKSYQSGRTAAYFPPFLPTNNYDFADTATNLYVPFTFAFDTAPVITFSYEMSDETLAGRVAPSLSSRTANGFTIAHTLPQSQWLQLSMGMTNLSAPLDMKVVNDRPAVACYGWHFGDGFTNRGLLYARAADSTGLAWSNVVGVAMGNPIMGVSLAVVDGYPAIAYHWSSNGWVFISYVRALNPAGTIWPTPVTIISNSWAFSSLSLAEILAHPAVLYSQRSPDTLWYTWASDAVGTAWPVLQQPDTDTNQYWDVNLVEVNGRPAAGYLHYGDRSACYVRASDSIGSSWGTPVTVSGTNTISQPVRLFMLNSTPAMVFHNATSGTLSFVRASDTNGATWGTERVVATLSTLQYAGAAVIGGWPAVAYADNAGSDLLYYKRSNGSSGSSWPDDPVLLDSSGDYPGEDIILTDVGGNPAVAYGSVAPSTDYVRYLRSGNPPTNMWLNWIAVEP